MVATSAALAPSPAIAVAGSPDRWTSEKAITETQAITRTVSASRRATKPSTRRLFPLREVEMRELVGGHRIVERAGERVGATVGEDRHEIGLVGDLAERLGVELLAPPGVERGVGRLEPALHLDVACI